jgi:hypothetical protein
MLRVSQDELESDCAPLMNKKDLSERDICPMFLRLVGVLAI